MQIYDFIEKTGFLPANITSNSCSQTLIVE